MTTRDLRRHHKQRKIAKVKRIQKHIWNVTGSDPNAANKLADNLAHCQNMCCNKKRKRFGPKFSDIKRNVI